MKMKSMHIISILFLITLLFLGSGCQENENDIPSPGYQDISSEELQTFMDNKEEQLLLVDVREEHEYKAGHIPGAMLLPLGELKEGHDILDKEKIIVLICRSGRRSADAAEFLSQAGYEKVYNLQGGMLEWPGPVEVIWRHPG